MKILSLLTVALFFAVTALSQTYQISGTVTDSKSNKPLADVPIYVKNQAGVGTSTGKNGKYLLNLYEGEHILVVDYLGYETVSNTITVSKNQVLNFRLNEASIELGEAVVTAKRADENVTGAQTGVQQMQVKQLNKLPVLLGEKDIIKSLELMPGVKSAGEGSTGFFVRGGSADQNLIMLDNVSVYNASHLMGFFSTFNSDVLEDVTLYKGGIPAQYGNRLSAILDVQQRHGDMQEFGISGGIGLISSKLNVEGPIKKGKSSFLIGGRRTYADALARLSGVKEAKDAWLYFYDLNMKLHFILSGKDRLSFSGYLGRDKMILKDVASTGWGTMLGSVKWTHTNSEKLSFNTSLSYNRYSYDMEMTIGMKESRKAALEDYVLKSEVQIRPNNRSTWRIGLNSTVHNIAPGEFFISSDTDFAKDLHHRYAWENNLFASNQLKLGDKFEFIYGLRLSAFSAMGKGEYYTLNDEYEVVDSTWYGGGEFVKTYINLEPRLSAVFKINNESSVKTSYARTTQNMHLVPFISQGTPYDRWVASSNIVKPQNSDQYTVGYFRNFHNNEYEFSIEGYYKDMRNQIDFKDNAQSVTNNTVETELRFGKGRAYGVELMLKKRIGRLSGWISYTLSKSEKKINGVNENRWYNAFQDRTHDVSIVAMYELSKRWSLSATWVYYTGNAITYPSGKYQIDGGDVMYYAERNGYRAPAYHRLDIGATLQLKKTKRYESELAFGLYNAYGRRNAYMIDFRTNDDNPTQTSAYRYALFTFVPSISWNFKF